MVLADDNFATIKKAIEEGRGVYENIRKSIIFLLSSNLGEIITMFAAVLCGLAAPLKSSHILWINLITDSLPALALGVDLNDGAALMRQKPRKGTGKPFLQRRAFLYIILWLFNRAYQSCCLSDGPLYAAACQRREDSSGKPEPAFEAGGDFNQSPDLCLYCPWHVPVVSCGGDAGCAMLCPSYEPSGKCLDDFCLCLWLPAAVCSNRGSFIGGVVWHRFPFRQGVAVSQCTGGFSSFCP